MCTPPRGSAAWRMAEMNMDSGTNISALYREIHRTCSWGMLAVRRVEEAG